MDDKTTTVAELKTLVATFCQERDWEQFHDPKNLVMALASEIGELADLFRWVSNEKSRETAVGQEMAESVAHELADVVMFALEFASVCRIDVARAIESKLKINAGRYPIDKAKGSSVKYNRL